MCVEAELALMGQMFTGAEDEVNRAHLAIGGQQLESSTLRETDVLTGAKRVGPFAARRRHTGERAPGYET